MIIRIRPLLDLRGQHTDQTLLDYLTLVTLAPTPGRVSTSVLRERWRCSQPQVSRRLAALQRTGLVDVTTSYGTYQVHQVEVVG